MATSLNVSLPRGLREFVDKQASGDGLYATPTEYVRALIRADMESRGIEHRVMAGLDDLKQGRLSDQSILDIADEI